MREKYIPVLILFMLFGFFSCQEVVTVNLSSVTPKVVVEGGLTNRPGPYTIKLSTTTNYFSPQSVNRLSGAKVAIADNSGQSDTLRETAPGVYVTSTIRGTSGKTYFLTVNASGQKYTASAFMTDTVRIDSLSYAVRPPRPGDNGNPSYSFTCSFTDPPAPGNHYGFRLYRNGVLKDDIVDNRIVDDKFINGNAQHARIRDNDLIAGDSVRIELISFDKSAYDFYNTLRQTLSAGGPFSAPPANPATNLNNSATGYFGVYSISSRSVLLH